jgi:WD40 repeat protein
VRPNSNTIITSNYKGPVQVWDICDGSLIKSFKKEVCVWKHMGMSHDGKFFIAMINETMLDVWNLEIEGKVATLESETIISDVQVSYSYILTRDRKGNVSLWDLNYFI